MTLSDKQFNNGRKDEKMVAAGGFEPPNKG